MGVAGHPNGWSAPFQDKLRAPPNEKVESEPLNHDFYELTGVDLVLSALQALFNPIKSVHQMALVHLQMAEFLVWMNGYANIDIISHSWGTTLTYDLQNNSGIETHNWVTMGSV